MPFLCDSPEGKPSCEDTTTLLLGEQIRSNTSDALTAMLVRIDEPNEPIATEELLKRTHIEIANAHHKNPYDPVADHAYAELRGISRFFADEGILCPECPTRFALERNPDPQ